MHYNKSYYLGGKRRSEIPKGEIKVIRGTGITSRGRGKSLLGKEWPGEVKVFNGNESQQREESPRG